MNNIENLYFASSEIEGIQFKIYSSRRGITGIRMKKSSSKEDMKLTKLHPDDPFMFNVVSELREYFERKRKLFTVPLDVSGTNFQVQVWEELKKIPYGRTVSYKYIADSLGDPNLIRAVGKANGQNPVPIVIPCHRVINADGSLGGYSGGEGIKERLLELEGSLSMKLF